MFSWPSFLETLQLHDSKSELLSELSACKLGIELTNLLFLPTMSAYSLIEYIFMHQFAYGE